MIRRQNRMKTSPGAAAMEILRKQGRNGDTELAHVNPREKALLKALGGAGSRNPRTGLREYYDEGGGMSSEGAGAPSSTGMSNESVGEGTNDLGLGGNFGGSMGGYLESAGTPTSNPTTPLGSQTEDRGPIGRALDSVFGLGPDSRPMGGAFTDPNKPYDFTLMDAFSPTSTAVRGLAYGLGRGLTALGVPEGPTGSPISNMAAFEGGPSGMPGNLGTGLGEMRNEAFVPVANPTPRYLRGGEMAPPQEISSFIGPGMSDIQQRALISTYGTQGVNSAFRTDPVRRYYANLLSRGLISDAGAPVQNPYVLPIEQQYASSVLGRPFANPADAAATYESIRGFL
jgi:hypothetical protein